MSLVTVSILEGLVSSVSRKPTTGAHFAEPRRGLNAVAAKRIGNGVTGRRAVMALFLGMATTWCQPLPAQSPAQAVSSMLGLPHLERTEQMTPALIDVGRKLFFDQRLSVDGAISCASCHIPEKAFTDGRKVASGVNGNAGTRNVISLINVAYQGSLFWDGRRQSLEAQASDPLFNSREHGLSNEDQVLQVIRTDPAYVASFKDAANVGARDLGLAQVRAALAAFERSLLAGNSAFDRYYYGGDPGALAATEQRGLALFRGRAQCVSCHTIKSDGALLTDGKFHTAGVGIKQIESQLGSLALRVAAATDEELGRLITSDADVAALGRFAVTRKPTDVGQYKTPSLRNVALTAPYMHDGSVATLEEAVERELYYRSVQSNHPVILTESEKSDLVAFLRALTSAVWPLNQDGTDEGVAAGSSRTESRGKPQLHN